MPQDLYLAGADSGVGTLMRRRNCSDCSFETAWNSVPIEGKRRASFRRQSVAGRERSGLENAGRPGLRQVKP